MFTIVIEWDQEKIEKEKERVMECKSAFLPGNESGLEFRNNPAVMKDTKKAVKN